MLGICRGDEKNVEYRFDLRFIENTNYIIKMQLMPFKSEIN